jgi:hypothetical protein
MQTDTLTITGNSRTDSPLLGEEVLTSPLTHPDDWTTAPGQGITYRCYANIDYGSGLGIRPVLMFDLANSRYVTPTLIHTAPAVPGTRYEILINAPEYPEPMTDHPESYSNSFYVNFGGVGTLVNLRNLHWLYFRVIITAVTADPLFVPLSALSSCINLGFSIRPILDVSQPLIAGPLEIRADGRDNISVGARAGRYLRKGSGNVCLGADAATDTDTCTDGVFLGRGANPSSTGSINEIVIGAGVVGHGSGTATIGNDATEIYLGIAHVAGLTIPDSSTGKLYRFTITDGILGTEEIL